MYRLQSAMSSGRMALLVELPSNSAELAECAEQAGADSLLMQVYNEHPVTGAYTGGPDLEAAQMKALLSVLKVPVGLHVGNQKFLTREDWEQIASLGFDYVAMNAVRIPPFVMYDPRIPKLPYVTAGMPFDYYRVLSSYEGVFSLCYEVASQVQAEGTARFNVMDIVTLSLVSKLSLKPVLFRVSQDVMGEDVKGLMEAGCSGLLLDPAFGGSSAEQFRLYTATFREAIDGLKKRTVFRFPSSWG